MVSLALTWPRRGTGAEELFERDLFLSRHRSNRACSPLHSIKPQRGSFPSSVFRKVRFRCRLFTQKEPAGCVTQQALGKTPAEVQPSLACTELSNRGGDALPQLIFGKVVGRCRDISKRKGLLSRDRQALCKYPGGVLLPTASRRRLAKTTCGIGYPAH